MKSEAGGRIGLKCGYKAAAALASYMILQLSWDCLAQAALHCFKNYTLCILSFCIIVRLRNR